VVKLAGDDKAEPGGHPLLQHRGDPAVGVELTPEERLPEIKLGSKGEDGLALLRVGEDLNLRADGDLLVHLVEIGGLDGTVQPQVPRGDEVRPGVATNKGHPRVQGPAWTLLDQRLHSEGQISGHILQVVHDKDASSLDGLRIPRNEKKLILFETGEAAEWRSGKKEAHIRADRLQVGGVIWPGYLNIKDPGVALFRELADCKESDE